ncbi:hypothetical protein J6590_074523 [Homalodisca vitripennis]|nr:hypothetical protein J6590_074523 [Homalodisca vitripennis]
MAVFDNEIEWWEVNKLSNELHGGLTLRAKPQELLNTKNPVHLEPLGRSVRSNPST